MVNWECRISTAAVQFTMLHLRFVIAWGCSCMETMLTAVEVRVLGSLVEKAYTTPENYPLSMNALINACNQKSNRDPVVEYDGRMVNDALESLRGKGLTRIIMGGDSRVPKYRHYFEEFYQLNVPETAVLCELMLRGPQTIGELRGRIERFGVTLGLPEMETLLTGLAARGMVLLLPLQPGRREARYAHLLAGEPLIADDELPRAESPRAGTPERLARLEEEVQRLRGELDALRAEFAAFRKQFE